MSVASKRRDYSLTGPENRLAQEKGLVAAEWYTSPIPRQRLKELMKRKDGPAIRDANLVRSTHWIRYSCVTYMGYLAGDSSIRIIWHPIPLHQLNRDGMNAVTELLSRHLG